MTSNRNIGTYAEGVALITFAALALSVTHEWGYFLVIGAQFQSFASTIDYFVSTLEWIPQTTIALFAIIAFMGVLRRSDEWVTGTELVERSKNPKRTKLFLRLNYLIPLLVYLIIIVIKFFVGTTADVAWFGLAFMLVWPPTIEYILGHERSPKLSKFLFLGVEYGPVLLVWAFFLGVASAITSLQSIEGVYLLADASGQNAKPGVLLRSFDKGILIRDPVAGHIQFLPWDKVRSVERKEPKLGEESWSCRIFRWPCKSIPSGF